MSQIRPNLYVSHPDGSYSRCPTIEQELDDFDTQVPTLKAALDAARHALTLTHNLTATDQPNAYAEAQRAGLSPDLAHDVYVEESWVIDNSTEIAMIDAVLPVVPASEANV